ncbi:hypothetical protein A2Y85_01885 [candidate division WOR-3 bacterium RBG_13_43_14]|uniref:Digeranylgeranylglyceryl phosphate synthase n=1 Tax=candidate division WOR-3 bacterium RBG_13_43_14 TaxID=1802590 RepID=A0A1F4UF35_UNCW3|nr:MAG: hypothetical protein A2Y85_01885 [candidate division WOR-3 bacterium RBG_13_43_14]
MISWSFMMSKFAYGLKRIINIFESTPLVYSIVFLFAWIFLRIFLEGQFEFFHSIGLIPFSYRSIIMYFIHFPMFYLSLFQLITIIISVISRVPIKTVIKSTSCGMILLLLVPILDAVLGHGYLITYPLRLEKYFISFLNPLVTLSDIGVSSGQRIVIVLIVILVGIYMAVKTSNIFKSILTAALVLLCIIIFGGLTTVIAGNRPELLYISGGLLYTDSQKFAIIYGILFIITFFISLYMFDPKTFRRLIISMRVERMAFYGGTGLFGLVLAGHMKANLYVHGIFDFFGIICIFLSLGFAFWALQILNDFFDRTGDTISRARNPLLDNIEPRYYAVFGFSVAVIALLLAATLNYTAFLIMITYLLIGVIYSMPPVRLKRFPFISTFVIAIAVILSMGMGFTIYFHEKALSYIPGSVILPTLIGVTLGFVAKDLNDIESDKKTGVITIPVLLSMKNQILCRLFMAIILSFSFVIYSFFNNEVLPGALIAGIITLIYTLFAKRISESVYFLLLYSFGIYYLFILIH